MPERIIQKTTGHRSLESLRTYERISTEQHQAVSRIMSSTKPASYENELKKASPEYQLRVCASASSSSTHNASSSAGRLFGDLTNCTIGKLIVNVKPTVNQQCDSEEENWNNCTWLIGQHYTCGNATCIT